MKDKKPLRQRKATLSKWNSLKHGLLAKDVVVKFGPLKEDQEQFDQLLADLHNDLSPVGALEEILVEEIAVCYWRLRRIVRAEVGEIMKAPDPEIFSSAEMDRIMKDLSLASGKLDEQERMRLLNTSAGIDFLISFLDKCFNEIEETHYVSPSTQNAFKALFGEEAGSFGELLKGFSYLTNTPVDQRVPLAKLPKIPHPEKAREFLLAQITIERTALNVRKQGLQKAAAFKRQVELLASHTPSSDRLETISRYETTIKRHLYRAIDQLERLKRRREGEFIPAPIKVDVRT